eukprot:CAMPEP_0116869996 /NCGR_PEP_ID=MMETSP0418-20121206/28059_1 /TAXON_ID=1158023 /ORGANISM="Astrosyne radiata, Strain 13vi08-1A" /LENGTH=85 /DNA_ID=CAMNT_0004506133 /DNA_START=548 /DNA_END=805 /DNA_ORIENTATION=+
MKEIITGKARSLEYDDETEYDCTFSPSSPRRESFDRNNRQKQRRRRSSAHSRTSRRGSSESNESIEKINFFIPGITGPARCLDDE